MKTTDHQNIPWHNPDNLTPEQVGEGWRLVLPEEIHSTNSPLRGKASGWNRGHGWYDTPHYCSLFGITYRTREPLPEKYWRRFQTPLGQTVVWNGIFARCTNGAGNIVSPDMVEKYIREGGWKELPADPQEPDYSDPAYRAKVEAAHKAGKRIQRRAKGYTNWRYTRPIWAWDDCDYRIHPDDDKGPNYHSAEYQKALRLKWAENPEIEREVYDSGKWFEAEAEWNPMFIYRERIKPPEVKRVQRAPLSDGLRYIEKNFDGVKFCDKKGSRRRLQFLSGKDIEIVANFIKEAK